MATKHDKTVLVGPALTEALGLEVIEAVVDTDVLGTFSGEIARVGSPVDTAVAKARMGMAAVGLTGPGSSGSMSRHGMKAAVDVQDLTGDHPGEVREKEGGRVGDRRRITGGPMASATGSPTPK